MNMRSVIEFVGDFETTVYEGQESTEVWASGLCEIGTENAIIFHSINETFDYLKSLKRNVRIYYHNLKFDGSFWLYFLLSECKYKMAFHELSDYEGYWEENYSMSSKSIKCLISSKGQFYSILIKHSKYYIEFVDSMKLLPFSVKNIGKDFNLKHQKLDIEYTGFRYAGCDITEQEEQYLKNDLFIPKEGLEYLRSMGMNKLTIGSCCLQEFKRIFNDKMLDDKAFDVFFPNLYDIKIDENLYGSKTVGEYILKSYYGGWCYVVDEAKGKVFDKGITLDVCSLYPSRMHSSSGVDYPYGKPAFYKGTKPKKEKGKYFYVRFRCRFKIKDGYLPFIHIRKNLLYDPTENLKTSDIYNKKDDRYYTHYIDFDNKKKKATVELTLAQDEYFLFREHYNVYDFEILDYCVFRTLHGIFDDYINKWIEIKQSSKGAKRQLAKLMLNNLYGKFATNTESSFKVPYINDKDVLAYKTYIEHEKKPGYIAIGSAITSQARVFTIQHSQMNYRQDLTGFIYADTDSNHLACGIEDVKGYDVGDSLNHWSLESVWDEAIFVRQKTYIERIIKEGGTKKYNMKCAGMPSRCKDVFIKGLLGEPPSEDKQFEKDFLLDENGNQREVTLTDFREGLVIGGKLKPKQLKGGILLVEEEYTLK